MKIRYQNQSTPQFLDSILETMTLEEKIGQLVQADLSWDVDLESMVRSGAIGSLFTIKDVNLIHHYQDIAVNQSRLGIPLIIGNDVIHGFKTILPIPLAQACSWNPGLIEEAERMVTKEALYAGTHWNFAPMVDVARDPRWGRIAEGSGEDPFLGAAIAEARVRAYQAEAILPGRKMAACVKHFAGYGAAIGGKDYNSVDLSERSMREVYFPPFQAALNAGCKTLMTAFHDLNAIPATANTWLLVDMLRKEWGFDGLVVSDFDAIGELIHHGIAADHKEAALLAARAQVDMDMMGNAYPFHLKTLLDEGKIELDWINCAVRRVLTLKAELGLFEHPFVDPLQAEEIFLSEAHVKTAKKLADESIVLLKNDNHLLPFDPKGKTIAVVGPLANDCTSILGCWRFAGDLTRTETILDAMSRTYRDTTIRFAQGCTVTGEILNADSVSKVLEGADVCVCVVGEEESMSGEAHSRAFLDLPGQQKALVEHVSKSGVPTVLVVASGRPLVLTDLVPGVDALLMAWHGGTTAGAVIADVFCGVINPSGHLPVSMPRSIGQIPVYYAHNSTGRPVEARGVIQFNREHKSKYLDESNEPLYPFGFGLSYAHFKIGEVVLEKESFTKNEQILMRISVQNESNIRGATVVQVYVRDRVASVARPVRQLVWFEKLTLDRGETKKITAAILPKHFGFYDPSMTFVIEPGVYDVFVGFDSKAPQAGTFSITG